MTNYATYSGDVSAANQTDYSQSNTQSNGEFWCIGGTPGTLIDGFDAWAESVPNNFALVDFTANSLRPISELTDNATAKEYIDQAIRTVLAQGATPNTTHLSDGNYEVWAKNDNHKVEVEMQPQDGYAVVGFGGRVTQGEFVRMAVCLLNLANGQREWRVFGDRQTFNRNDYETIGEVPDGSVLTGIGLLGHGNNFKSMVLYYQELTPARSTNHYLAPTVSSKIFNYKTEVLRQSNSFESEFQPDGNEGKAIVGIGVGYGGGSQGKVDHLKLYRAPLVEVSSSQQPESDEDSSEDTADESMQVLTVTTGSLKAIKGGGNRAEQEIKANSGQVIVGFGARIEKRGEKGKNSRFSRIAVQTMSLKTNQRQWHVTGDVSRFKPTDYECLGEVPEGCVLTGIGLREKDHNLANMVFYYQAIDRTNTGNSYLNPHIQTLYIGSLRDQYEAIHHPAHNDTGQPNRVIVGIGVSTTKSEINVLKLYQAELGLSTV